MHNFGEDWAGLVAAATQWLEDTAAKPLELLRYTGLWRRRGKSRQKLR